MSNIIHNTVIIEDDVELGEGNIIEPYVIIKKGVKIGNNNLIQSFSTIGDIPQTQSSNMFSSVVIGNNNLIGKYVSIDRGTKFNKYTIIGNNNSIYAYCHIAHDCIIGNDNLLVNNCALTGNVVLGNNITLYGHVYIYSNVNIGNNSVIGGATKIKRSVPPYTTVIDKCNNKVISMNKGDEILRKARKILYKSNLDNDSIIKELGKLNDYRIEEIIEFIKNNKLYIR